MQLINEMPSSVGSGVRDSRDFYLTPYGLISAALKIALNNSFLSKIAEKRPLMILDAGAGTGRWGAIAREIWPNAVIVGIDKHFTTRHPLYDEWFTMDFIGNGLRGGVWDLVISNPPFKLAEEFVTEQHKLVNNTGLIIDLLPLNFMCGQNRSINFWPIFTPFMQYALARRPDFGGKSGPKYECALYVFSKFFRNEFLPLGVWPVQSLMWEYDLERDPQAKRGSKRKGK